MLDNDGVTKTDMVDAFIPQAESLGSEAKAYKEDESALQNEIEALTTRKDSLTKEVGASKKDADALQEDIKAREVKALAQATSEQEDAVQPIVATDWDLTTKSTGNRRVR